MRSLNSTDKMREEKTGKVYQLSTFWLKCTLKVYSQIDRT